MSRQGLPLLQEDQDDSGNDNEDGQVNEIQELHTVCCSRGSPLLRVEISREVLRMKYI
jgi:hypothetical protein